MKSIHPLLFIFISLLGFSNLAAQTTQTIRGQVIDADAEIPLIGATIELLSDASSVGTTTDIDGYYALTDVSLGRHLLRISYLGYEPLTVPNILVTAGKEVLQDFKLVESINNLEEVVVIAETEKDKAINELATVSAKTFSMEEVNRYSGGRSDVSRLVSNFAGVATADDSRNDIVIRGNSPTGVLWRLEGVQIPNPNHFATLGTTGGPVSALNPNLLKNSDFITSAFPSEYGNALSGVFDVGFRSGNRQKFETTLQLGAFSGLEAMIEGPLNKKKTSSFVVSFRNSFVALANELGIDIGTAATPNYRDLSFKFDFDAGKAGRIAVFGIGATSDIDFIGDELGDDDLFADANSDSYADSRIGVVGIKHNKVINNNAYIRTTISASTAQNDFLIQNYFQPDRVEKYDTTTVNDVVDQLVLNSYYNLKQSARLTIRAGVTLDRTNLNSKFRARTGPLSEDNNLREWVNFRDVDGALFLIQPYAQAKYKLGQKLTANLGVHGQFLTDNNTGIVEPRAGLSYQLGEKSAAHLGYGLHSQTIPLPFYYLQTQQADGSYTTENKDLEFTKAHHFVLGYDYKFAPSWRLKAETYYQALFDVPVETQASTFSLLNVGADFAFPRVDSLVNEGTGKNYGVELTVEKFFSDGFYGLLTGSLFQSKFTGSDGVERNTGFNNQYVLNVLAGKEFQLGKAKRSSISFDFKLTNAGGRFYTPVDLEASKLANLEVKDESRAFEERYDPYFRLDFKVGFRMNSKKLKMNQQFFLDFQNITNRENVFINRYNNRTNEVNTVLQSGFFPDILYRIQF